MAKKENISEQEMKEGVIRKYFENGINFCAIYEEMTEIFGWRPTHAAFLSTIMLNAATGCVPKDTADEDILYIVDVAKNSRISPIKGAIKLRKYNQSREFKTTMFPWNTLDQEGIEWFMNKQDGSLDRRIEYLKKSGNWY